MSYTYAAYYHHQFDHPQPPPYIYNAESQPPQAYPPLYSQPRDPPDWQHRHQPLVHAGFHPPHAQPPDQLDWKQRYDPLTQPLPDLDHFDSYSQLPYTYPGQFSQPQFTSCNIGMLQQPPTQTPDYMEWKEPYLSHAQLHHAARQPDFQQLYNFRQPEIDHHLAAIAKLDQRWDNTDRRVNDWRPPPTPDPAPPYFGSTLSTPYQTSEYHNGQLESQPPLLQNQYAHDPHIAPHSGWYQQPHHSHLNIDEQTLDPYYRLEAYQQRADDQLSTQPPYTGFDLPEPPLYRATEPLGMPRDPVTPNLEPNLQWVALVSQLERLTATVEQLVSQMDANKRFLGDPHSTMRPTSHLRTAAPLTAAAAVSSLNLPQPAPPCSRDISRDEGELLDDDPLPLAVISQSVDPNTSPTSVPHFVLVVFPGSIKMGISKGVKRDYSSSSLDKRIVTEKFHNLDDIGFNDEANPINGDVARMNHRPTSLDGDTRLIRPRKDTSCLSILGRVDKLPVLTLNFGNHNGHPLMIFDGGDEGRCSTVRCAFDPGGDT